MSQSALYPRPVGFVGSMALASAAEVFGAVSEHVGSLATRIPDGETGERLRWIGWQRDQLVGRPGIDIAQEITIQGPVGQVLRRLKLKDGYSALQLQLRPLGYLEAARASFAEFENAREQGKFDAQARFQISLPSPMALASGIAGPRDEVLQAFELAYRSELSDIFAAIPPDKLAIQWDLAQETHMEESRRHPDALRPEFAALADPRARQAFGLQRVLDAAARACEWIPAEAELGIHLCYGDADGKHIIEPHDTTVMSEMAGGLTGRVTRRIDWIHMPVPIERDDDAYFAPLKNLRVRPDTTIFLGLIHHRDGLEGARRRIDAAQKVLPSFGVATECGMGRRDPTIMPELLALHRRVAELEHTPRA